MCGINGIAGYNGDPIHDIGIMNECIIRRGPDAGGHFTDERRHVVIGHRRLSIIDLSEAGAQPMESHDGRYIMAYNGEIYNAPEIREKLTSSVHGLSFNGTSDTEILLEAISVWGLKDTLVKCRGMWGISLYDREDGSVMLTRDRIGEKPLYYGMVNGQFVWSSDIRAIASISGFNNPINKSILPIYLRYGYIPAPYTIYKNVYKLTPGTILTVAPPYSIPLSPDELPVNAAGFDISPYYSICEVARCGQAHLFDGNEEEAADELEARLKNTLKGQMLSDVPLGAFLSGGIDSTMVVSLMQQISDRPVRTFTIGFEEEAYNEATFAEATAKHLGTQHTQMYVGYKDVMGLLPVLSEAYGEPFADSSQLPTMLVSKMTKEHVTVALSGDAGDEFYCGYNTYKDAKKGLAIIQGKLGFLKGNTRRSVGRLAKGLDLTLPVGTGYLRNNIHTLNQVLNTKNTVEDYYRAMSDSSLIYGLIPDKALLSHMPSVSDDSYTDGLLPDGESNLMLMDMLQYLPDDILTKVDRAGMYYSLETRIPLLDADVMELAWSLPLSYKMDNGITKKPLRNILYRYVPKDLMDRPKKGFSVPVSRWLREGEMREWAEAILKNSRSLASEYINVAYYDKLWNSYQQGGEWSKLLWHTLILCDWLLKQ